jgi:hypothetical protein
VFLLQLPKLEAMKSQILQKSEDWPMVSAHSHVEDSTGVWGPSDAGASLRLSDVSTASQPAHSVRAFMEERGASPLIFKFKI